MIYLMPVDRIKSRNNFIVLFRLDLDKLLCMRIMNLNHCFTASILFLGFCKCMHPNVFDFLFLMYLVYLVVYRKMIKWFSELVIITGRSIGPGFGCVFPDTTRCDDLWILANLYDLVT